MEDKQHNSGENLLQDNTERPTTNNSSKVRPSPEEPKKKKGSPLLKLTHYMKKHTWLFVVGILTLFGGQVGEFAVPAYIGMVIDTLSNEDDPDRQQKVNVYVLELFVMIGVSFSL